MPGRLLALERTTFVATLPAHLVEKYRLPDRNLKFVLLRVQKGTGEPDAAEKASR